MAIEHADFDGIERLALVLGGEVTSTFDHPDKVKLGECALIDEIMIGEDTVCSAPVPVPRRAASPRFAKVPPYGPDTLLRSTIQAGRNEPVVPSAVVRLGRFGSGGSARLRCRPAGRTTGPFRRTPGPFRAEFFGRGPPPSLTTVSFR